MSFAGLPAGRAGSIQSINIRKHTRSRAKRKAGGQALKALKTLEALKALEPGVTQTRTNGTKGKEGEAEFANNGEPQ